MSILNDLSYNNSKYQEYTSAYKNNSCGDNKSSNQNVCNKISNQQLYYQNELKISLQNPIIELQQINTNKTLKNGSEVKYINNIEVGPPSYPDQKITYINGSEIIDYSWTIESVAIEEKRINIYGNYLNPIYTTGRNYDQYHTGNVGLIGVYYNNNDEFSISKNTNYDTNETYDIQTYNRYIPLTTINCRQIHGTCGYFHNTAILGHIQFKLPYTFKDTKILLAYHVSDNKYQLTNQYLTLPTVLTGEKLTLPLLLNKNNININTSQQLSLDTQINTNKKLLTKQTEQVNYIMDTDDDINKKLLTKQIEQSSSMVIVLLITVVATSLTFYIFNKLSKR